MRIGYEACTYGLGVDLDPVNHVAEIGAGGDGAGKGVVVRSGTLRRVDLAEKLERIWETL